MSNQKIVTQLTADQHEQISCQLLQLKGVIGLILAVTGTDGNYKNLHINSSAWLVTDTIEHIRNTLDEAVAEE